MVGGSWNNQERIFELERKQKEEEDRWEWWRVTPEELNERLAEAESRQTALEEAIKRLEQRKANLNQQTGENDSESFSRSGGSNIVPRAKASLTADASDEVNQQDLQAKRDQEERDRMADVINHWAAGKEGNLLALLSTLQYVLWPECGWQPISQADLISADSVKKVYRKAILCVHPDKVQQKGANLQQKYISEKVFYLLKEAWKKL